MTAQGATVVWLTHPHIQDGIDRGPKGPFPEDDPARMDELNQLVREVVATKPRAEMLDLEAHMRTLPEGEMSLADRPDGIHWAKPAALALAPWLGSRSINIANGEPPLPGELEWLRPSWSTGRRPPIAQRWSQRHFRAARWPPIVASAGWSCASPTCGSTGATPPTAATRSTTTSGANLLATGHGFINPYAFARHRIVQAADHPPLYLVYLAAFSLFGHAQHHRPPARLDPAGRGVDRGGRPGRARDRPAGTTAAAVRSPACLVARLPEHLPLRRHAAVGVHGDPHRAGHACGWPTATGTGPSAGAWPRWAPWSGWPRCPARELVLFVPLLVAAAGAAHARRVAPAAPALALVGVGWRACVVLAPWVASTWSASTTPCCCRRTSGARWPPRTATQVYYGRLLGYWHYPCGAGHPRPATASGPTPSTARPTATSSTAR